MFLMVPNTNVSLNYSEVFSNSCKVPLKRTSKFYNIQNTRKFLQNISEIILNFSRISSKFITIYAKFPKKKCRKNVSKFFQEFPTLFHSYLTSVPYLWLLAKKRVLAPKTIFHRWRFSMFDRLVLAFYWSDSIENCGVFFAYNWESKINACDFFVIFSVPFSVDYDS